MLQPKMRVLASPPRPVVETKPPVPDAHSGSQTPEQVRLLTLRQKRKGNPPPPPIPIRQQDGIARLSSAQAGLWYFCRHEGGNSVYTIPRVFEIEGALDVERLRAALSRIMERHEVLRTVLEDRGGEPFQIVQPASQASLSAVLLDNEGIEAWLSHERGRTIDLATGPLFDARLASTSDQKHFLVLIWHHIISDQHSSSILDSEIGMIYQGREPPKQPVQYGDYAEWEFARLQSPDAEEARDFWRKYLDGAPPLIDIGFGRVRPAEPTHRGEVRMFEINLALAGQIRAFGISRRVTLFPVFLAAWTLLLSRYSNRTDLMVGVPVSGRDVPELERLIGYFVNLLPLRLQVEPGTTFEGLVRDCWARFSECSTWALPFDAILKTVGPERSRSYPPIFQFVLNYLRGGGEGPQLEGTKTTRIPFHNGYSQFDVTLTVLDRPPHFRLTFEYNTAIFDLRTIAQMGEHLLRILSEATVLESVTLAAVGMLSPEDRHAALYGRNATEESIDPDETVLTWFDRQVTRNPAIRMIRSGEVEWSCQEINAFGERVRTALEGKGIRPGDVVAVTAERSPETVGTIIGIWKCGAIWLPLDPRWPAARTQFVIGDSAAKIMIDAGWLRHNLSTEKSRTEARASANSIAYVLYTSGSTGNPKGVAIRHASLLNCLLSLRRFPGFAAEDKLLSVAPLSFDISLCEILLPLISGTRLVFPSLETATNPRLVRRLLEEHDITVMHATPSMWQSIIDDGWRGNPKLRAWCGGEAMPPDLAEGLLNRAAEVWNLYGPTETTICSAVHRVRRGESPVPIGRPMANTQCYVLDANLQPVPDGVPGELFVGGAGVSTGYWGHAKELENRFTPNPFAAGGRLYRTGDMARWSLTNDLIFLDRADTQVKVRGHRIELSEVETVMSLLPVVRHVAVGVREEALVAWIVLADAALWDPKQLRTELRTRLPDYMVPGKFVLLNRLPLNSSGKVDRRKLLLPRKEAGAFEAENSARDAEADPTEQALRDLWEEALDFRPIALNDNFFDLGGHSLLAAKLFGRIEKVFGRRLPDWVLIQAPTIAGVASILRTQGEARGERGFRSLVPIQPLGSQPPFFCVPVLGGSILGLRELGRCLGPDQPVYGIQALGFDGPRPPPCRVEDIAAHYVREICSLEPDGPYYLGGYCFGGLVAFEMARQLTAGGRQVGLLAIIDAVPRLRKKQGFMKLGPRMVRSASNKVRKWGSAPKGRKLSRLYAWLLAKSTLLLLKAAYKANEVADIPVPSVFRGLEMAQHVAAGRYLPGLYPNVVTLFRRATYEDLGDDPSLGWLAIAASVEILEIPGEHATVLGQPHVKVLAHKLKHRLLTAQAQTGKANS